MTAAVRHPAKFSEPIMASLDRLVRAEVSRLGRPIRVLDPFAGTGRVHRLARAGAVTTVGVEIEPEWAGLHPHTVCADCIAWMLARARRGGSGRFDLIVTSPCYGNRFSDCHEAKDGSRRRSYRHDLDRMPTDGSAGVLPWGPRYWSFHAEAYRAMHAILVPGGRALVNVSDFYRNETLVHAVEWHQGAMYGAGFVQAGRPRWIATSRMTEGANRQRAEAEAILVMERAA